MTSSQLIAAAGAIAVLFTLASIAALLLVYIRGGARDEETKRLRGDRDDYLSRLNYIEPRFEALKTENATLRALGNPVERINELGVASAVRDEQVQATLDRIGKTLQEIEDKVHVHPEENL